MSTQHVQYVLLFLVLAINSDRFVISWSYTLLLSCPLLTLVLTVTLQVSIYSSGRSMAILLHLKVVLDAGVRPGIGGKLHTATIFNDSSTGDMEVEHTVHCHMHP